MSSYAVVWNEENGPVSAGRLELERDGIRLEGAVERDLPYRDISRLRVGRSVAERLAGKPALLLELVSGGLVSIASIGGPGTLSELAERLAPHL